MKELTINPFQPDLVTHIFRKSYETANILDEWFILAHETIITLKKL
jgi:hypothetical protein